MFRADSRSGRWPVAVLLLLLALLAGCDLAVGPSATVEEFHQNISEGKIEDAISLIAPESIEEIGADKVRTLLRSATQDVKKKGGIKVSRIEKEEITGKLAKVTIYIEHGDGSADFHDVNLVQRDGEWLILFELGDK